MFTDVLLSLHFCAQRTVVPENVCDKCQRTCDINGNQQPDAFLDMDPENKWKPSTVSMSTDLSPCEPFGHINNNSNYVNNNTGNDINNVYDDDDDEDDDDDGLEPDRPYALLASSPPLQRSSHQHYQQQQPQQQIRLQPRFSSTCSLDRTGTNRDHSTDSLDRVEYCSITDYR